VTVTGGLRQDTLKGVPYKVSCVHDDVRIWPIATGDALTAGRHFRGIADMAGPASWPGQPGGITTPRE